uniref:SRS domain-containing protein n=1 Tax=Sarcocystis aucheniae TaxID=65407 RepID=A0A5P9S520_9APIC|nr:hypothetical protein [Sarcocystis aucheniae]
MKLPGMVATAWPVRVTLALALFGPSSLAASGEEAGDLKCAGTAGVVRGEVTAPGTVKIICVNATKFEPQASDGALSNVLIGPNCDETQLLTAVSTGASGQKSGVNITFTIQQMPPESRQFCVRCGADDETLCTAEVYLKVTATGGPQVCETPGGNITLNIPAKNDHAAFACAYGLYPTPTALTKVFAEDCTTEEDLHKMTRAADKYGFTVTATNKPEKKRLCYLCGPEKGTLAGNESKFCTVYIQTGAGARALFDVGLSLTLPCLLAALHFT